MNSLRAIVYIFVLTACSPLVCSSDSTRFTFPEGLAIEISVSKFEKENHQVTLCGEEYVCLVDGLPIWGTDGKIPQEKINSINFTHNKYNAKLDTSGMYDPLITPDDKARFSVSHYFDDSWKVRGRFSDGAGSYYVEWLVTKNGSTRTAIGDSESLYEMYHNWFGEQNN